MARARNPDLTELGVTGLKVSSGHVREEWLRQLQWPQSQGVYAEMRDNDPVIGAMLFSIDMLIRGVNWWVEPASEDEADIVVADFVEGALNDMSSTWESTVSEIISFLWYGYSYHEVVYKRRGGASRDPSKRSKYDDGRIGWRKVPIRAQPTITQWVFSDDDGSLEAALQRDPNRSYQQIEIPIQRALLFRTTHSKGNPEGRSILRNAFRPWYFKKRIEEIEAIGIERDLAGLPIAYVPARIMSSGASSSDTAIFNSIKDIIRNVRRDEQEGVVFPGDRDADGNRLYEMDLLSTGGQRQIYPDRSITRYDQRIAMTALADFILLGHDAVGTFALSKDKTAMFGTAIKAWLDEISTVMNRHAIPRLLLLNGMDVEELPILKHGETERVDLAELGDFIDKLAGAGAPLFPDDVLENALRDRAGLPGRPEGEGDEELVPLPRSTPEEV